MVPEFLRFLEFTSDTLANQINGLLRTDSGDGLHGAAGWLAPDCCRGSGAGGL